MDPVFSIILPAYNEEGSISLALKETGRVFGALGRPYEVIVVDDGSTDRTVSVVESLGRADTRLIRHDTNAGKGAAVKTGVAQASGDHLLFLDCDLATHPSQFLSFLPHLETADVLIGSRRVAGANIVEAQPPHRVLLGRAFNLVIRRSLDLPFSDTQCGFKVFTREAAQQVFPDLASRGWTFDVELLLRARNAGLTIKELPVEWRHGRESRVRVRDAWKILKEIRALRGVAKKSDVG